MTTLETKSYRQRHPDISEENWSQLRHDMKEGIRAIECLSIIIKDNLGDKALIEGELTRVKQSMHAIYAAVFETKSLG